ncbi:MAG: glycosyltransferase family 2 protein [Candidatus Andersenbacteria bacterium]|nr:glycosyltransferase family 2 protein [Candidatus Andersenbacteria bacterium]
MKLSIIIVNYKTAPLTAALVESLLKDDLPKGTEIIVVDNGSGDESVSFLRSDYPEIMVIDNRENKGLAAGVNAGLAIARGQHYLVLNPDMIALPGAVATLTSFMDGHSDVGMAAGKLISPNGKLQYSCYRYYKPMTIVYRRTPLGRTAQGKATIAQFLMKDFDHKEVRDVDWLMGACLMARREVVKKIGGMDEQFFLYFEDVDWCRRVWEAGWRVTYVPQAMFSHFHQRSSDGNSITKLFTSRPTREHIKSAVKYFWKYRGRPTPVSK